MANRTSIGRYVQQITADVRAKQGLTTIVEAVNPNDGHTYVWDWNQDTYYDKTAKKYVKTTETQAMSARDVLKKYGLEFNSHEKGTRDPDLLDMKGPIYFHHDSKGKVMAAQFLEFGGVASIPAWKNIDWNKDKHAHDATPKHWSER